MAGKSPTRPVKRSDGRLLRALTRDGACLGIRHFQARGTRRAVCLCTHAMMANGRYFWAARDHGFAGHLTRAGMDVYVLDWRGHGQSAMPRASRGWYFDDYVERDAPAAVRVICRHAGIEARELVYIGHSLGGLVGLAALATETIPRVGALALFATSVWTPGARGSRTRRAIMRAFELASRPLGYVPARALRMGSENEPRRYVAQLAGWARDGVWRGRSGVDYLAQLWRVEVPTWASSGLGDRLCRPADAEVLRSRLPRAEPLIRVGRDTGFAHDANHFSLLTDPALSPLWDGLLAFLGRALAAR